MDNFTLFVTLLIVAAINTIFTFATSKNAGDIVSKQWRLSSILVLSAFCLMLTQAHLPKFISIIIANYLLLLGFYFQIYTALRFEFKRVSATKYYLSIITFIYSLSFLYFTYVEFHTTYRIVIISAMLAGMYGLAVIQLRKHWKDNAVTPRTKEMYYLFLFASVFYIARTTVTIIELGSVNSLFDKNLMTTISFLFLILFNLVFLMGMFKATIRDKNLLVRAEKDKLNHLFDFLSDTAKYLKLEDLYPSIEAVLRKTFRVNTAAIFLKDEGYDSHSISYIFNELNLPLDKVTRFERGQGLSGQAIEKDKVIMLDIDTYPNKVIAEIYKAKGVTNMVGIPLKTAEGVIGAIVVVYSINQKNQQVFDNDFFYYLGEQVGLVIQNALLYKKLALLADTDSMTGLLNRRKMKEMFLLELKKLRRSKEPLSLAIIDLDHFKQVNDVYGHECGDHVIKDTVKIFEEECRETDYICRWGGEEFLCIFVGSDIANAEVITERIRHSFEQQTYPCLDKMNVTISVGVAEYRDGLSMEQLIALADKALYQAKEKGRNRIELAVIE